jgi:sRNA-binding protein
LKENKKATKKIDAPVIAFGAELTKDKEGELSWSVDRPRVDEWASMAAAQRKRRCSRERKTKRRKKRLTRWAAERRRRRRRRNEQRRRQWRRRRLRSTRILVLNTWFFPLEAASCRFLVEAVSV